MILMKDIIREGHPNLTKKSIDVSIPVSKEDKELGLKLLKYCIISQNDKLNELYNLRPGVGISAVQINVLKRMFAMHFHDLEGQLLSIVIVNPKIVFKSKEMIYLNGGEGCLSVDRVTSGLTPRHETIIFEAWIYNPQTDKFTLETKTLTGYAAIVFQHEFDHLDGILYVSKLFKELPEAKPLIDDEE